MGVILPSMPPDELLTEYIEIAMRDADFMIFVEDGTYLRRNLWVSRGMGQRRHT